MNIEFYNKHTGEVLQNTDDTYFVMNDAVFKVSDDTFESQAAVIDFNTFTLIKGFPASSPSPSS